MAQVFGATSSYLTQQRYKNKYAAILFASLLFIIAPVCFISGAYFKFAWNWRIFFTLFVGLLAIPTYVTAIHFIILAYGYKKGWKGESIVLRELYRLPEQFSVFPDVHLPGEKWNIDFVVTGPTGVFSIEVKNMKGEIEMEGKVLTLNKKPSLIIKQVEREYWGLHDYLLESTQKSIFISPIVVFVNGKFARVYGDEPVTEQIRVLNHYKLVEFLQTTFQKTNSEYIYLANQQLQRLVSIRT